MPDDLYSRLFRYRSRERRAPLEDFLTEALADFLNRAPREITTGLVSSWLNAEGNAAWSLLTREGAEIAWTTQGVLLRGRARFDLMLSIGGRAAVIVESKVGSGIRAHSEVNDPALGSNQLQTYGRWLADQRRNLPWPGALILIDYAPVPPADFDDGRGYGGVDRSAVAWSNVARFIRHSLRSADTSLAWVQLGQDLIRFMEAQGMPSDTFNSRDVAVFQLYLDGVKARLEATTSALWESLRGTAVFEHSGKSDDEDSMAGGCHWQWAYLTEPVAPSTGKWYFAFGLRFPDQSTWWKDVEFGGGPQLFVAVSADSKPAVPVNQLGRPEGWRFSEAENALFTAVPLGQFEGLDVAEMGRWLRARAEEVEQVFADYTPSA